MNGNAASLSELHTLHSLMPDNPPQVVICPPAPLLFRATEAARGTGIQIGAQDCHMQHNGAFTGDISSELIADTGATFVIVGHSERRDAHEERDRDVRKKAKSAWESGLTAIICIGETLEDHEANNTLDMIAGADLGHRHRQGPNPAADHRSA